MAPSEWVLDTQILEIASAGDNPLCLKASALLDAIQERHFLAVDVEGHILQEYARHIPSRTHAAVWWSQISLRKRLVFYSQKLTNAQERSLTRLKFDHSDWKFLGVACQTQSHLLVAEESDYWQTEVAHYIQNEMNIALLRVQDATAQV